MVITLKFIRLLQEVQIGFWSMVLMVNNVLCTVLNSIHRQWVLCVGGGQSQFGTSGTILKTTNAGLKLELLRIMEVMNVCIQSSSTDSLTGICMRIRR